MEAITKSNLEHVLSQINQKAGFQDVPLWTRTAQGNKATVGMYDISGAYGGHKLEQIVNDGGGVRNITQGFDTKRNLYYQMRAFLAGMRTSVTT